ncbi:MAG: DUF4190 domain-containing protein [Myxococcota bacterium]
MPAASLILGLLAFFCTVGGMLMTMVPFLGSALSFGAPILSLFGLVMGGVSMSRAQRMGDSSGLATAGLVVNIITFVLSLGIALTCGMCNACFTSAAMNPQQWQQYQPPIPPPSTPYSPTTPTAPPITSTTAPPPSPAMNNDAICEEARACCLVFADQDATFCDSSLDAARTGPDPSAACRQMMEGWASGLRAMGRDVPASCTPTLRTAPAANTMQVCTDHCTTSHDGECDDGRAGSMTDICPLGSDCTDCGPVDVPIPTPTGICTDTCATSRDGECDDGRPGAHTDFCASGTDCSDCGPA